MIEADAAVVAREDRHLLPPAHVVAARAVSEDDREAGTVLLVVELDAVYISSWQSDSSRVPRARQFPRPWISYRQRS